MASTSGYVAQQAYGDVYEDAGRESLLQGGSQGCDSEHIAQWISFLENLGMDVKPAAEVVESDFIGTRFESLDQAESFYMLYGKLMGFSVRRKLRQRNKKGIVTNRSWVCSCEGHREDKYCNLQNRLKEARPITRTGCPALFFIRLDTSASNWCVKQFIWPHNHVLAIHSEKAFLRSNRRLSDSARELAMTMKRAGIRTSEVYKFQTEISNGWQNVGYLKRDLYKGISKKYSESQDVDMQTALSFLEAKKGPDAKFFYKYEVDEDRRLTDLFWSEGSCQVDYKAFGDCLSFDATYKTNRYGKPLVILLGSNNHDKTCVFGAALLQDETAERYVWLLQTFLECMDHKMPETVLTDGCKSMNKALETVMPGIPHRICSWHILKNSMQHVHVPGFNKELKEFIFSYYEEDEWEQRWRDMVDKHQLADNIWVQSQYATRNQWADTYLRHHYFGGARATGRCESMNAQLKSGLENKVPLWMFFRNYEYALSNLHYVEMQEHYKSNLTETLAGQTTMTAIDEEISAVFTREIYGRIRDKIKRADLYIVRIDEDTDPDNTICHVKAYGSQAPPRKVTVSKDRQNVECSCNHMVSKGIPCSHIFASMKNLEMMTLPVCLINRRWLKTAKTIDHSVIDRDRKLIHPEADQHARYGAISKLNGITAYLASQSNQAYERASKVINDLNVELEGIPVVTEEPENVKRSEGESAPPVLDPNISITKGRPTVASRRRSAPDTRSITKSNGQTKKVRKNPNHCRICRETGHDSRNCKKKNTNVNGQEQQN